MNTTKMGFIHSLGVLVYISLVALLMQNGEKIFGKEDNWASPIAFLLLFTLSAIVVGLLVLGKPIVLYLDNKKKEAVKMLVSTAAFIAAFTIFALVIVALV